MTTLKRAIGHHSAGTWPAARAADRVTLDFDARHRRRIRLVTEAGEPLLLDLPAAVAMADGDGLSLEDGGWIAVIAAPEPLLEIRCPDPTRLMRIAWHLGNRHLATELRADCLRIRRDHVIAEMVRGLGGSVAEVTGRFQPEGGAYGHGHHHEHDHG